MEHFLKVLMKTKADDILIRLLEGEKQAKEIVKVLIENFGKNEKICVVLDNFFAL